jgi:hypothetical protein
MSWTTAENDLRNLLSDNATDKYRYRKKVFGEINGVNTYFKTFEFRRLTDFTTSAFPLGVYIDGVFQVPGAVASDSLTTGDFVLLAAPTGRVKIEASYYVQWFLTTEIQNFLKLASNWLGAGDLYSAIAEGLRPAALKYSAAEAYQKLSLRWAEHLSEVFLLNDAPVDKEMAPVDKYRQMSLDLRKEAEAAAKFVYSRSAQNYQPLYGIIQGQNSGNPDTRR